MDQLSEVSNLIMNVEPEPAERPQPLDQPLEGTPKLLRLTES